MIRHVFRSFSSIPSWASVNPFTLSASNTHEVKNFLDGKWVKANKTVPVIDPLNGEKIIEMPFETNQEVIN